MPAENNCQYEQFQHKNNYPISNTGWDKYANDYSQLLQPETIYYLTKELAHEIISAYVPQNKNLHVLDLNCGTGNDFPFFLKRGWTVCGCDGSAGMLKKATEQYSAEINNGRIELFIGKLEFLNDRSFGNRKFDLIFSVTGGYSYIDNKTFMNVNQTLSHYLKKDGILITAHLNSFCLPDILYHFLTLRWHKIFLRKKKNLTVQIKGEPHRMYLRNVNEFKKLTPSSLRLIKILPLLAFTPPYQTGYKPSKNFYHLHKKLEMIFLHTSFLSSIADQIVTVYQKKKSSPLIMTYLKQRKNGKN